MGESAPETPAPEPQNKPPSPVSQPESSPAAQPPKPTEDEPLGEGGKRALQAERDARKSLEKQVADMEAAQRAQLDGLAKALGFKSDDAPPDPAVLQQTLSERESRVSSLEQDVADRDKELAAWRVAATQNVNAVALLDSRSFLREIASLEPAASDFPAQVEAAVRTAVTNNPALRANPIPTAGQAGIGAADASPASQATPGLGRLREAYSNSNTR